MRARGGENVSVRLRPAVRGLSVFAAVLLAGGVAACGGDSPAEPAPATSSSAAPDPGDARVRLAVLGALAEDHRFAALYRFDTGSQQSRNVVATVADDGSWRVDVAGGALGGSTDVAIVSLPTGVFQCSLSSATNPISPTCVRVAGPGKRVPKDVDPRVERLFRQSPAVFTDRQAALSVSTAQPLPGSQGSCFSVDSISASLNAPVDVGIYCYADNGLLTAARVDFGTITIASTPVAPPAKVNLPGPIVDSDPMSLDGPPAPTAPETPPSPDGSSAPPA
jgi:hypothetical protein